MRIAAFSLLHLVILGSWSLSQQTSVWPDSMYRRHDFVKFEEFAPAQERIDFDSIDYPLLQAAIFYETNRQRALLDLPPLSHAEVLERIAAIHSHDMVEYDFLSHSSRLDGKENLKARLEMVGLYNVAAAENISNVFGIEYESGTPVYTPDQNNGYFSYEHKGDPIENHTYISLARAVLKQLLASSGHRDNILNPRFRFLGVGAAHYRDTTFFNIDRFKMTQVFTTRLGKSD